MTETSPVAILGHAVSTTLIFLLITATNAVFADNCPAVDCGCAELSDNHFRTQCFTQEKRLKEACADNNKQPTNYCHIQGRSATPSLLKLVLGPVITLNDDQIENLESNIETMTWSLRDDMSNMINAEASGEFKKALGWQKSFAQTRERMFATHRQMAESWLTIGELDDANAIWEQAANDAMTYGVQLLEHGKSLQEKQDASESNKKAYAVLALRALRNAGKEFERAGEAFRAHGEFEQSAQAWEQAAKASILIADWKAQHDSEERVVNFYRSQASSRFYQAAMQWSIAGDNTNVDLAVVNAEKHLTLKL
ncbi:hypothetical protein [Marinibactrum halimedae]|uniref:Tetratricopeptide repeat protein n=1 Tax=Marinibactrum halimedae TaxID=1444977 RepID=A0AA37WM58_9GAMM|nr:hypothetical protein [Marinibactrum halimedae]MCD9458693.1 hypothetical protein [Marinibactrum halimedae]GLS25940.1 hypothetical protein GCM10007877_16550 [Marinibactrum halimedae]